MTAVTFRTGGRGGGERTFLLRHPGAAVTPVFLREAVSDRARPGQGEITCKQAGMPRSAATRLLPTPPLGKTFLSFQGHILVPPAAENGALWQTSYNQLPTVRFCDGITESWDWGSVTVQYSRQPRARAREVLVEPTAKSQDPNGCGSALPPPCRFPVRPA